MGIPMFCRKQLFFRERKIQSSSSSESHKTIGATSIVKRVVDDARAFFGNSSIEELRQSQTYQVDKTPVMNNEWLIGESDWLKAGLALVSVSFTSCLVFVSPLV